MSLDSAPSTARYEAIVEAASKGHLWPQGQCLTTGCSSELPILKMETTGKKQKSELS